MSTTTKKMTPKHPPADWVRDLVVIAMPAAAVGGKQAGVYTAAENGIVPWGDAIIRWLTSRSVRGNAGVLIRQEGPKGGAGLSAVVDRAADYVFEVLVHVPGGSYFGTRQEEGMQVWAAVLDENDRVVAEEQVDNIRGDWAKVRVAFFSGDLREVRCVVYAKSVERFPCLYYADGFRLVREDYLWWNPQNSFNAPRTVDRLADNRQALLDVLQPDAVAGHNGVYLNWDGFFTERNILVGAGNWEQEYNHVSIDDPALQAFEDNGIARDIDGGRPIGASLLWPGYQMCHNAPAFRDYYIARVKRVAPEVSLFTQDNINMASFQGWGKGCFCKWCRAAFSQWLAKNSDLNLVKQTHIRDFDAFDIRHYVDAVRADMVKKGEAFVLKDPVLRAYLLFHYDSQVRLWQEAVDEIKRSANRPIAVMGNQYGSNGEKPFSVALSQSGDVVCTESNIGTDAKFEPFDRIKTLLLVKLGWAAGEFKRPVWLQYSALFHSPVAAKSRLRFISAQSLANNGIPFTWATAGGASGWFFDAEAEILRFMGRHRDLFVRCDAYANVGLVYSLPTHMWSRYAAFELASEKYQRWFYIFAKALEQMHVSYEVNCWWHPLLGSDAASMERLRRYKLLILPGVECFTSDQLEALRLFKEQGGRVIQLECSGFYDANREPLPEADQPQGGEVATIPVEWVEDYDSFVLELEQQVTKALGEDSLVRTDAPGSVWSSLKLDASGRVLSLHLVNGDINEADDCFNPVYESRWQIKLPDGLRVDHAKLIRMETPEGSAAIPVDIKDGIATVSVPVVEGYSIVVFYANS